MHRRRWSLATGWFARLYPGWSPPTYWIVSALAALLLFGSVLVHELAHSLVARARGLPVRPATEYFAEAVQTVRANKRAYAEAAACPPRPWQTKQRV